MNLHQELGKRKRGIGEVGNTYGGLSVATFGGKYYWSIEDYSGDDWNEIDRELFVQLEAHEDERQKQNEKLRKTNCRYRNGTDAD